MELLPLVLCLAITTIIGKHYRFSTCPRLFALLINCNLFFLGNTMMTF